MRVNTGNSHPAVSNNESLAAGNTDTLGVVGCAERAQQRADMRLYGILFQKQLT